MAFAIKSSKARLSFRYLLCHLAAATDSQCTIFSRRLNFQFETRFPWLKDKRFIFETGVDKYWVLNQHQCSKFAVVVNDEILSHVVFLDESMTPRNRYIICDSDIALTSAAYLNTLAVCNVVCVYYIEDLLTFRSEWLKNDVVLARTVDFDDVYDFVVICDFERKVNLAQLAVKLLEFYDKLLAMDLARAFGLEPAAQAFKVDAAHSTSTFARWD